MSVLTWYLVGFTLFLQGEFVFGIVDGDVVFAAGGVLTCCSQVGNHPGCFCRTLGIGSRLRGCCKTIAVVTLRNGCRACGMLHSLLCQENTIRLIDWCPGVVRQQALYVLIRLLDLLLGLLLSRLFSVFRLHALRFELFLVRLLGLGCPC